MTMTKKQIPPQEPIKPTGILGQIRDEVGRAFLQRKVQKDKRAKEVQDAWERARYGGTTRR